MEKKTNILWCPKCNTMRDITKNKPNLKKNIDAETTEGDIKNYINLINSILKNKKIDPDDISDIKLETLVKTKMFKGLKKEDRDIVSNKISTLIKESDETVLAYFACSTCGWSQEIPKETKILSKSNGNVNKNVNLDRYKNMVYSPYLGITRGYICVNDKCKSHKEYDKREAVYFRDTPESTRTIMVCKECKTPWIVT